MICVFGFKLRKSEASVSCDTFGESPLFCFVSSLSVVVVLVRVGFGWVWVRFGGNRKFMLSLPLMLPTYVWSRHSRFDGNSM